MHLKVFIRAKLCLCLTSTGYRATMRWRHLNAFKPPGGLSLLQAVNLLLVICCLMFSPLFVVVMDLVLVFLYITYCGSEFNDKPPFLAIIS